MLGIAIIFFISVYLVITLIAIRIAVVVARRFNRRGWVWGLFTGLVMYNLVLWDLIPSYILFNYYCNKDAGVHIYVDAEQWIKEHPEAMQPFKYEDLPWKYKTRVKEVENKPKNITEKYIDFELPDGSSWRVMFVIDQGKRVNKLEYVDFKKNPNTNYYYITNRLAEVHSSSYPFYLIRKITTEILDIETEEVLAKHVFYINALWIEKVFGFSFGQRCKEQKKSEYYNFEDYIRRDLR
ncbi:hypothetical protein JCM30760_02580 [Thiomicrorhabdus hydrogeniphila]